MTSRTNRVTFVLLAVVIAIAAGSFLKTIETTQSVDRAATDTLQDRARLLTATLAHVRAGQVAYVARGQGQGFWINRVTQLLPVLDQQLVDLELTLESPAAQSAIDKAAAALENFHKLDARAQQYVKIGDDQPASDLIFSDGLEASATAASQIDVALKAELAARSAGLDSLHRTELATAGAASSVILTIVMLLGLSAGKPAEPELVPLGQPVAPATSTPLPRLGEAAQLCTDFTRVVDTTQLAPLLERAAQMIDASGIIVWMAAAGGRELRPALTVGYSDQAMAKMRSIPREAANAAAAAYRFAEMRTVNGDATTAGAVVVPLITPDGCIGVLSAEMKGGSEKDESSQALAAIFAAQLATLVTPPAAAEHKTAANG